ncbi:MAG: 2-iminobutanoate/2-iminopropanoate deaminase [Thermoleophilaceae bacterium]|jgi:enamine deaminase RidA (YjgF/YER057c/UK114 family)|nr:2-iminobutanoate/2-iminopropanoate deaminase [Thermoleophilaceae bacterium]
MRHIEEIKADGLQEMFSADAVRYGDLVFVSGCVPLDTAGNLIGRGDLERQTRKTLENLELVLRSAGTDFEHVLKTTVYLTDIEQRGVTHAIRREIFGARPPASTMVEVSGLGGEGIEIEIDAIAAIPASSADASGDGASG